MPEYLYITGISEPETEIDFFLGILDLQQDDARYTNDSMVGTLRIADTPKARKALAEFGVEFVTSAPRGAA